MEIIKSFRKTLSLSIDKTGKLIVKAPAFVSVKAIENFILKNKNWIEDKKQEVIDKIKLYKQGEKYFYFWEEYELKFLKYDKEIFWKEKIIFDWRNFIIQKEYSKDAQSLFEKFFKLEAKKYLTNRLSEIALEYDLKYNLVKITSATTRWGSCTSQKNINFTYRLIWAPLKTIDYVIIHELAHLKHMNHSKLFRAEVEKMMKWLFVWDYKTHKLWLKQHSTSLQF